MSDDTPIQFAETAVADPQPVPASLPPEPGTVTDTSHGIEGPAEELPEGDADNEEGTDL